MKKISDKNKVENDINILDKNIIRNICKPKKKVPLH